MRVSGQPFLVGSEVLVKTCSGKTHSGAVFALDEAAGLLILRPKGTAMVVLNLAHLELLSSKPGNPSTPRAALPHFDPVASRLREERAVQAAEAAIARLGVGVRPEAQGIFDALAKTLPVRWQGKDIMVLDEVRITEPYTLSSLVPVHPRETGSLERIAKVLDEERKRLGLG